MSTFFAGDFLIPVLIGNAELIEDIPSFIGFYRHESVDQTVRMLSDKIISATIEDNFLSNMNAFIAYLCDQIYKTLKRKNIEATLVNNNEIVVSRYVKQFSLIFTPDPSVQAACILVRKYITSTTKRAAFDTFPTFILTWKKKSGLYFSIHEFDCSTEHSLVQLSFHDVMKYILAYIVDCLED